jgi:hypothetical protein
VLLGNVHMYINGPTLHLTDSTHYSFDDGTAGGWPTFTFFVKVGTARSAVTAFVCGHE